MTVALTPSICYVIYTRISTEKTEDFSSCDSQFLICQEYIKQMGESNLRWYGSRFDDNGYSGPNLNRPAMSRLRKAIELGAVKRVYAVALDRISRKMQDVVA